MLVSSANSIELAILFRVREKSFMYVRKSSGPNIEPWGTPCFTGSHWEVDFFRILSFITTRDDDHQALCNM